MSSRDSVCSYIVHLYAYITKKNEKAKLILNFRSGLPYINRPFAYCKGGNFNIHIWAWFGYSANSSAKQGKSGSIDNLVKNK